MSNRNPAVQGRFYPDSESKIFQLLSQIEGENRYPLENFEVNSVIGAILPHAGHIYSGHQTIPVFQLLNKLELLPEIFVILHPNHSGIGDPISLDESLAWTNALGEVPVDQEFSAHLSYPRNRYAHSNEHSGEVILPFIQYYFGGNPFSIVPICMLNQNSGTALELGKDLYKAANLSEKRIMVIASSDFSHFMSANKGHSMDQLVLDEISDGNIEGVYQKVNNHHISVCGYGPIMALMAYSELVNSNYCSKIIARGHSGEVSPSQEVVNYISMLFYE